MITAGKSLYTRLAVRMALVLTAGGLLLSAAIWYSTEVAVNNAYDRLLTGSALQIAENTWYENGRVNVDVPLAAFAMLTPGEQVLYNVIAPDGHSAAGDPDFKPPIPWDKLADGPIVTDARYQDVSLRIAIIGRRMPVASGNPWAVIVMAQSKNGRDTFLQEFAGKILAVLVATGILTVIAALSVLYQALTPLTDIEHAIRNRNLNELTPLTLPVPREILVIVSAINAFMVRLTQQRRTMQRVIGNAAHQLRTPVTALISQIELLEEHRDEARRQEHLARLKASVHSLGALVNQLISHAMVLHRADAVAHERIDLKALVAEEFAEALSNHARQLDIEMRAPDHPCLIDADLVSVREAIRNIIGNALRYGARSLLHIQLSEGETHTELRIIDDGPGISESQWDRVREPFSARSNGRHGASLGLSIVNEVMRAHHGSLHFERVENKSFTVILRFPRPTA